MESFIPASLTRYVCAVYDRPTETQTLLVVEPSALHPGRFFVSVMASTSTKVKAFATQPAKPDAVEHLLRAMAIEANDLTVDPGSLRWQSFPSEGVTRAFADHRGEGAPQFLFGEAV